MATKLEDLVIRLKADSSELERELRKSGVAVNRFSKQAESGFASISSAAKKIGATLAVAFAVNKLREFASAALELGSSLNDTAARLGTTAESLQIYRLQAKEAGVDSGAVDSSLQSFAKTLGQLQAGIGRATKQLAILDPTLLAALKTAKSTDEAYRLVADAIHDVAAAGDQQRASAIASATGMAPLLGVLKEGAAAFDTFSARARASGLVLSDEASAGLDAFEEALDRVKQTALVGFAEGLAGADAGAQSFTATLSDPEMLQGLHDLAAILGTIALAATKVAEGFEWAVRATRELTGILPHVQGAIPPNETVWSRNVSTMPGVLPYDYGQTSSVLGEVNTGGMSIGTPWDMSAWSPGSTGASRPRGTAPAKGGKSKKVVDPLKDALAQLRRDQGPILAAQERISDERMALEDSVTKNFRQATLTRVELIKVEAEEQIKIVDRLFLNREKAAEMTVQINATTEAKIRDEMEKTGKAGEKIFDEFADFAGDVVSGFILQADQDFAALARSMAASLTSDLVKNALKDVFAAAGGGTGGGGTGIVSMIIGGIGSILGFAEGGHFTRPTLAVVGDGQESEWALPDSKLKGLLAASGGRTVVNVHNYGNEQVTTKSRQSGGQEVIDVMVGRSIRRQLGAGALKDEFGRRHAPGVS